MLHRRLARRSAACTSSPAQESAKRLPNRACALAALTMRASFSNGDLTGGIVNGLRMLADSAGTAQGLIAGTALRPDPARHSPAGYGTTQTPRGRCGRSDRAWVSGATPAGW